MRPGDLVVVYSDGITDATDANDEMFGLERLRRVIAAHAGLSARGLVELIFHAVETFSRRARPTDDQTVVVIRRPAEPQV
jgi:sigma-B regulation protein RsbU (phosphoserine phosphatase)